MAFWRSAISAWSASFVDSSNISMLACKLLDCFSKSLTWRFKLSTFPFKPAMLASFDVTRLSKSSSLSASSANCLPNSSIRSLVCSSAFSNASSTASISFCKRVMAFWRSAISAWRASFVDSSNISILACKLLDCFSKSLTWRFKLSTFPFKLAMLASLDVTRLSNSSNLAVSPLSLSDKLFNWFSNASLLAVASFWSSCLAASICCLTSLISCWRWSISTWRASFTSSSNISIFACNALAFFSRSLACRFTLSIWLLRPAMFASLDVTRLSNSSSLVVSPLSLSDKLFNWFSNASLSAVASFWSSCLASLICCLTSLISCWRWSISAWRASFTSSSNISIFACKVLAFFSRSLAWRFTLSIWPLRPAMLASLDVTRLSNSSNLAVSSLSLSDKLFNWFSNASLLAFAFLATSSLTVSSWVFTSSIASLRSAISFLIESSNSDDLSSKASTRSVNSFASCSTFSIFCLIEVIFSSFLETRSVKSSSLEASSPNCDSSSANSFSRTSISPLLLTICSFILLSSV